MNSAINIDTIAALIARAFAEARIVSKNLHHTVIPEWPSHQRSFPIYLARRLSGEDLFDAELATDLETFLETLKSRITAATEVGWVADEYDTEGGAEVRQMDAETASLALCASNLDALLATIRQARDGARAIRIAEELLDI